MLMKKKMAKSLVTECGWYTTAYCLYWPISTPEVYEMCLSIRAKVKIWLISTFQLVVHNYAISDFNRNDR